MSRYLDMVDNPVQVKKLTLDQLQQLAEEIRYEMITGLSKNGGHLGPNLGVVELARLLVDELRRLRDRELRLLGRVEVHDLVGHLAVRDLAVRRLDEAELRHGRHRRERADQADVRTLRRLDRAHAPV